MTGSTLPSALLKMSSLLPPSGTIWAGERSAFPHSFSLHLAALGHWFMDLFTGSGSDCVHGSKAPPLTSPREFSATDPERTTPCHRSVHPPSGTIPGHVPVFSLRLSPQAPRAAAHTCVQLTMSLLGRPTCSRHVCRRFYHRDCLLLPESHFLSSPLRTAPASCSAASSKPTVLQTAQSSVCTLAGYRPREAPRWPHLTCTCGVPGSDQLATGCRLGSPGRHTHPPHSWGPRPAALPRKDAQGKGLSKPLRV